MVRAFLVAVGREVRGMHEAAYVLALAALLSQLLALVRDRLLASSFGASHTLDLYYAAFRVPDFLFATVASLLSLYALLPILSRLEHGGEGRMISFLRRALLVFFSGMAVIAGILFVFAPALATIAAPGLASPELVLLMRILLLQPILLGASNILASLTQLRHRFVLYSISPLLYNFGIIVGIVFFYPHLGLAGIAWGVVLGALLHVGIQIPFFAGEKVEPLSWRETFSYLKEVLALSVPRTLTLAAGQIALFLLVALASLFTAGSISIFMFAYNLQAVPLAIIGVSYSVAAFPTLSRLHAQGAHSEFAAHLETALRHILFWSMPATVFVIVLRANLVRTILGAGAFDWQATRLTAAALALFVVSLACQSITMLIARAYYAAGKTQKPLLWAAAFVAVSTASAVLLVGLFHSSPMMRYFLESLLRVSDLPGTTVLMLALAYALGACAQMLLGLRALARDFAFSLRGLSRLAFQSFSAAVLGGAVAYLVLAVSGALVHINTALGVALEGAAAGLAGLAVTVFVLWLLDNQELAEALAAFKRRFKDSPPVALEPTDISS